MKYLADRRSFIKTVTAAAVATSLARLPAAFAAAPELASESLGSDLWLFTGAGGNVVACRDSNGVALVDGGLAAHSRELLKRVAKDTGAGKVHTLFNTHWHPEQTGSNEALAGRATIIAHENTRLWLQYANPVPPGNTPYGPLPAKARPDKTFYWDSVTTRFGDEPVEYGYLPQAHTDGDIYVFFRKSNVLVTGGPVSNQGWPVIDYRTGGWIEGLGTALKTLLGLANDQTRIVPANGPVMTRADLAAQEKMYADLGGQLQRFLRQSLGPDEVIAKAPAAAYEAKMGDSKVFVDEAFRSLWGHMAPDA